MILWFPAPPCHELTSQVEAVLILGDMQIEVLHTASGLRTVFPHNNWVNPQEEVVVTAGPAVQVRYVSWSGACFPA